MCPLKELVFAVVSPLVYTGCETIPSKCNCTVEDKIRAFVKANMRLEQSELAKLTSQGRPVKLWVSRWCAFYVLLIQ